MVGVLTFLERDTSSTGEIIFSVEQLAKYLNGVISAIEFVEQWKIGSALCKETSVTSLEIGIAFQLQKFQRSCTITLEYGDKGVIHQLLLPTRDLLFKVYQSKGRVMAFSRNFIKQTLRMKSHIRDHIPFISHSVIRQPFVILPWCFFSSHDSAP